MLCLDHCEPQKQIRETAIDVQTSQTQAVGWIMTKQKLFLRESLIWISSEDEAGCLGGFMSLLIPGDIDKETT